MIKDMAMVEAVIPTSNRNNVLEVLDKLGIERAQISPFSVVRTKAAYEMFRGEEHPIEDSSRVMVRFSAAFTEVEAITSAIKAAVPANAIETTRSANAGQCYVAVFAADGIVPIGTSRPLGGPTGSRFGVPAPMND